MSHKRQRVEEKQGPLGDLPTVLCEELVQFFDLEEHLLMAALLNRHFHAVCRRRASWSPEFDFQERCRKTMWIAMADPRPPSTEEIKREAEAGSSYKRPSITLFDWLHLEYGFRPKALSFDTFPVGCLDKLMDSKAYNPFLKSLKLGAKAGPLEKSVYVARGIRLPHLESLEMRTPVGTFVHMKDRADFSGLKQLSLIVPCQGVWRLRDCQYHLPSLERLECKVECDRKEAGCWLMCENMDRFAENRSPHFGWVGRLNGVPNLKSASFTNVVPAAPEFMQRLDTLRLHFVHFMAHATMWPGLLLPAWLHLKTLELYGNRPGTEHHLPLTLVPMIVKEAPVFAAMTKLVIQTPAQDLPFDFYQFLLSESTTPVLSHVRFERGTLREYKTAEIEALLSTRTSKVQTETRAI